MPVKLFGSRPTGDHSSKNDEAEKSDNSAENWARAASGKSDKPEVRGGTVLSRQFQDEDDYTSEAARVRW